MPLDRAVARYTACSVCQPPTLGRRKVAQRSGRSEADDRRVGVEMTETDDSSHATPQPDPFSQPGDRPPARSSTSTSRPPWESLLNPTQPMPIGIAYPVGLVRHRKGPATTFRLVVGKVELEGRWICVGLVLSA